jgi:RNA polymerase sigma-70 factor (ECF subfamily)
VPTIVVRARPLDHAALSDVVLVVRARDGDARALEVLVGRHERTVHALARQLVRDPEDARDAAQEALAKACARLGQFRGEAAFSTWLHRLVVNTCRDVAERQARRRHEPLDTGACAASGEVDAATRAVDAADAAAAAPHLRRALGRLSPAQLRVVVLRDVLALSYEEIAEVLELPVGTVKCHAHRAHRSLRERLEAPLRRAG